MRDILFISLGAVFGANARYLVGTYFVERFGPGFPYGTLFINISGSFLFGFIITFLSNRLTVDPAYRLALTTGFLGAYTTFSSFSYETILLVQSGDWIAAIVNSLASVLGAVLAGFLGIMVAGLVG